MFGKNKIVRLFFLGVFGQIICSTNLASHSSDIELVHYTKNKDSENLKSLIEQSYIIHRVVDPEELKEINAYFDKNFLSAKDIAMFFADHVELMPGVVYMVKNIKNKQTIGFVVLNTVNCEDDYILEINFFGLHDNKSNTYDQAQCIFDQVVLLAKKEKIKSIQIDLQNNEHEQEILNYCQKFGFTILNHPYLHNGFTCLYNIE